MSENSEAYLMTSQNLAPIWFPHWPAWMWTISLILVTVQCLHVKSLENKLGLRKQRQSINNLNTNSSVEHLTFS